MTEHEKIADITVNNEVAVKKPAKDFELKVKPPEVARLNKKVIIVIGAAIGFVVLLSIRQGLTQKQNKKEETASKQEVKINKFEQLPPEIAGMPASYKEMPHYNNSNNNSPALTGYYSPAGYPVEQATNTSSTPEILKEEEKARSSSIIFAMNNVQNPPVQQQVANDLSTIQQEQSGGKGANINPDDMQNMQAAKKEFLKDSGKKDVYMESIKQKPITSYQVNAGTIIPANLITGINSDLPGDIIAQVRENIYDTVTGNFLLIPQGTKIVGEYDSNVSYGQSRVLLVWKRLEFPNGSTLMLSNLTGSDLAGYAGLSDKVDNHTFKLISAVLFSSLLNVTADQVDKNGNSVTGSFAADAAQGINKSAQDITKKQLNVQPTIMIRPGYSFNIIVNKNIAVGSYGDGM